MVWVARCAENYVMLCYVMHLLPKTEQTARVKGESPRSDQMSSRYWTETAHRKCTARGRSHLHHEPLWCRACHASGAPHRLASAVR